MRRNKLFVFSLSLILTCVVKAQDVKPLLLEYWFDAHIEQRQSLAVNGDLCQQLDISQLCKGIHTLEMRLGDTKGRWSAPLLRYFLIPDLLTGVSELIAYEYWFNHGPRHRVETAKQSALDLNNVLIEVKDVVPNGIADSYTFNAADEMVMTPDDVFFGLQVFNGDEQGSQAVLSDTFAISVPVNPHFLALNNNEQLSFDSPGVGMMQGLKTQSKSGQQLSFTFDIQGAKVDFYDAAGNVLAAEREMSVAGGEVYHVEAADDIVYALIYDVSGVFEKLTVSLSVAESSYVDNLLSGIVIHAEKGKLVICSQRKSLVTVVNAAGRLVFCDTALEGKRVIELPKGIYIVKKVNDYVKKVLVP